MHPDVNRIRATNEVNMFIKVPCSLLVCLSALLVGGCGPLATILPAPLSKAFPDSMSEEMRVRSGTDPRNQDAHVRFRATYYLRVTDSCQRSGKDKSDESGKGENLWPETTALYRFRMTGKAKALFSKVKFESGVLHKSEIDPFGSTIIYDEQLGRHKFASREEIDSIPIELRTLLRLEEQLPKSDVDGQAAREIIEKEAVGIKTRLKNKLNTLLKEQSEEEKSKEIETFLTNVAEKTLRDLMVQTSRIPKDSQAMIEEIEKDAKDIASALMYKYKLRILSNNEKKDVENIASALTDTLTSLILNKLPRGGKMGSQAIQRKIEEEIERFGNTTKPKCPNGSDEETTFWLMGPEGVKEVDSDERLVLAMMTFGTPLISGLKMAKDLLLEVHSGNDISGLLAREYLAASLARKELDRFENEDDISPDQIQEIIDVFNQKDVSR